jgi:hypothetical protein
MSGRRADSVSRAAAEASHLVLRTEIVSPEKHGSVRTLPLRDGQGC